MSKELTAEEKKEIGEIIEYIREEGITVGSEGWRSDWSMKIGKLGGRPCVQFKDLISEIEHYIKNYEKIGDVVPTNLGLAVYLGINQSTLYVILNKLPDEHRKRFSDMMKSIRDNYKHLLKNKALKGEVKERMAMFLLNIDHGMIEQTQATLNINGKLSLSSANSTLIQDVIDITPQTDSDLLY